MARTVPEHDPELPLFLAYCLFDSYHIVWYDLIVRFAVIDGPRAIMNFLGWIPESQTHPRRRPERNENEA